MTSFENEARERFGETEAYSEHKDKTKNYTPEKWSALAVEMNSVFKEFAECKKAGNAPDSEKAQALVTELKKFITENYYTCTVEILKGLGEMYVTDERFRSNINQNGSGTAEFVSEAIRNFN